MNTAIFIFRKSNFLHTTPELWSNKYDSIQCEYKPFIHKPIDRKLDDSYPCMSSIGKLYKDPKKKSKRI